MCFGLGRGTDISLVNYSIDTCMLMMLMMIMGGGMNQMSGHR